jgi:2-methylcitrate dehydratase PrpD
VDYRTALLDWLACAAGGNDEPAARAASEAGPVAAAGTAGHVLDFDDTYLPGLAHLSAPTAPAALVLGAELGCSVGDVLGAYAAGFEAMGAFSAAAHPALYGRGWHPTAVCGTLGAAVTAGTLLGLEPEAMRSAAALGLLRAGGLRAAFGSDGKSLQVGLAAAAGVEAARLAAAGARVPFERAAAGFEAAFGVRPPEPDPGASGAIEDNWIKPWPCCLQSHGAIEAALGARGAEGPVRVRVHPVSLQAASYDDVSDGLEAKFSIPYLTAFTLLHGAPRVRDFRGVDEEARRAAAERVEVSADPGLLESEAILEADGAEVRVEAAQGSPGRPLAPELHAAKLHDLAGDRLEGVLDDPDRPARDLLLAAGLA